jgi:hypothetical protein
VGRCASASAIIEKEIMKKLTGGICVLLATSLFGCGAGDFEEPIAEAREAINVSTWAGLVAMGTTGTYTLTANINASGRTWTPKTFSGTFDGGNFTISNLTINSGSFFSNLNNATVKNVKFTNVTITGSSYQGLGGIASAATDSRIENSAVELNMNVSAWYVGGLVGMMNGGSIYRSYAKGTLSGTIFDSVGGLVGLTSWSEVGRLSITESYAQVVVNPNTPGTSVVRAGGIIGSGNAPDIHDVYAVGNVTGRGGVGGIIGELRCSEDFGEYFMLYKTIYRGDVVDKNWSASGGWAGPVGTFSDCTARFEQNFYDRTLDASSNYVSYGASSVQRYTTTELRSPTSVIGGVFCAQDVVPGRCGDNTWSSPPWTAGTSSQHHVLLNMPGPNVQSR